MALQGVQALLFDVFGTVVDWQGGLSRTLEEQNSDIAEGELCRENVTSVPGLMLSVSKLTGSPLCKSGVGVIMELCVYAQRDSADAFQVSDFVIRRRVADEEPGFGHTHIDQQVHREVELLSNSETSY